MSNKDFILAHSGVKGMSWGKNRFRNPDGTLNEAGKERYYPSRKKNSEPTVTTKPNNNQNNQNNQNNRNNNYMPSTGDYRNKASIAKEIKNITDNAAEAIPRNQGKKVRKNYDYISDKELQDRVKRLELEEKYGNLTGETKYVKSGSEKAKDLLHTVGSVVAIAASAFMIASLVQDMKLKKQQNQNKK